MFTIKSTDKYVLENFDCGTLKLSSSPNLYKTRRSAEDAFEVINNEGNRLMQRYTELANREQVKIDQSKREIEKLTAKLEDLYTKPFKEVELRVRKTRDAINNAQFYVSNNSVRSYRQSASRLQRILHTIKIVELTERLTS